MKKRILALMVAFILGGSFSYPSVYATEVDIEDSVNEDDSESEDEGSEAIDFIDNYDNDSGFEVTSLKGYRLNDGVKLILECTSKEDRWFTLFNPPNGDEVMKKYMGKIKPGKNIVTIYLKSDEVEKLEDAGETTLKFIAGEKFSYIYFSPEVFEDLPLDEDDSAENRATREELDFRLEKVKDSKFNVSSIKGYKVENGVRLIVNYTSPDNRDFSIFNPPNGDIYMKVKSNAIKKGSNSLTVDIRQSDIDKVKKESILTMKFGFGSTHSFAIIDTNQFDELQVKEGIEIPQNNEVIDFTTKSINDSSFSIASLKAYKTKKGIKFLIECKSPDVRDMSLFNPPNGKLIMKTYKKKIKSGKNNIVIDLSQAEFKKIMASKELTMKFGFNDKKTTFLFFNTNQLMDIPGENDAVNNNKSVSIPDVNLRAEVKKILNTKSDKITLSQLKTINELNVTNKNISDLTGLEHMTNLVKIDASGNPINKIPSLKGLNKLISVYLSNSSISDIKSITEVTGLKELVVSMDPNIDTSGIEKLKNLQLLCLNNSNIDDISFVKGLKKLNHLEIIGNSIEDITPLKSLDSLKSIAVTRDLINDIEAFDQIVESKGLKVYYL